MGLREQARSGRLVCPDTRLLLRLTSDETALVAGDQTTVFEIVSGVPILLPQNADASPARGTLDGAAYHSAETTSWRARLDRFFEWFGDHRSLDSEEAFERFIGGAGAGRLFLSIGGGPRRRHPALVTVNIARCENVDVVGDAHRLPYADGSVDGIECEAVLEHLESPQRAVEEFFRVLRPGGEVYAVTPFLQKYHGYPGHFSNFTVQGHRYLFERAGFEIDTAGPCVGPAWAITDLATEFVAQVVPIRGARALAVMLMRLVAIPIRILDVFLVRRRGADVLCSTTFVSARKPS